MSLHRNQSQSKRQQSIARGKLTINSPSPPPADEDFPSHSMSTGNFTIPVEAAASANLPQSFLSYPKVDLKKEYIRFCKLYSSEPLEIVSTPLERASFGRDPTFVDLKGRGLRGVDCIALGKILASDAPISHLNLSDCLLLPQGFQALLEGLTNNSRLHTLELRGNNIQGTMVCILARLLKANNHIKRLLLEWNCLGTTKDLFSVFCEGLAANTSLEILDLRNNQLNAEAAIELASALHKNKSIRNIDLRWNSIGVAGAKAIWDSLRTNFTLQKIQLCGNFIPDEIVSYIEQCLQHQSEREKMMEEYASRTHLLTRQLQKNEKNFKHELESMISLFDAEEHELKTALEKATEAAKDFERKLRAEVTKTEELSTQVETLTSSLNCAAEKEESLRKALEMKDEHMGHLETFFKDEVHQMKAVHDHHLKMCRDEIIAGNEEVKQLNSKITSLEEQLQAKIQEYRVLEESMTKLKSSYADLKLNFKERIKLEGEKWSNLKSELETSEHQEIKLLENELKHMQNTMMDHIRQVEKSKTEAERKIHELELELVSAKASAEEALTNLRNKLKDEQKQLVDAYKSQLSQVQLAKEKLESEVDLLKCQLCQAESDTASYKRQNENLRKQITRMEEEATKKESEGEIMKLKQLVKQMEGENEIITMQSDNFKKRIIVLEKELSEKDTIMYASLMRARNEVKELSGLLSSNKIE